MRKCFPYAAWEAILCAYRCISYHLYSRAKHMTGSTLQPRLSQNQKNTIVAELLAGKATRNELAKEYEVNYFSIGAIVKRQTGQSITAIKSKLDDAIQNRPISVFLTERYDVPYN